MGGRTFERPRSGGRGGTGGDGESGEGCGGGVLASRFWRALTGAKGSESSLMPERRPEGGADVAFGSTLDAPRHGKTKQNASTSSRP